MNNKVPYPPVDVGDYSEVSLFAWGMIPVRCIVSKRVEGWCAYLLLKYMPESYNADYGDPLSGPTPFERVRANGDKMPESIAREQFKEMEGYYVP